MPKTVEQLEATLSAKQQQISAGMEHIMSLMTSGLTVKDPRTDQDVTFSDGKAGKAFLNSLYEKTDLPLYEFGRPNSEVPHMIFFMYSKGFKPEDIEELITNPGSERSMELEQSIAGFRKEYFDTILGNDADRIAKMYVDGFRNLATTDISWLRDVDTPEKLMDSYTKLAPLSGVYSYYYQSNRLGAHTREADKRVMDALREQADIAGFDHIPIFNALSYTQTFYQTVSFSAGKLNDVAFQAPLLAMLKRNTTLPEHVTLQTLNPDPNFSMADVLGQDHDVLADAGFFTDDYVANLKARFEGSPDAVETSLLVDSSTSALIGKNMKWGTHIQGSPHMIDADPEVWKEGMAEDAAKGEFIDTNSVFRCVSMAKAGNYDAFIGIDGESERMLRVISGDHREFDQLSDLSKAIVMTRYATEHPGLFNGTVQGMLEEAVRLGTGPQDPVYTAAMNCVEKTAYEVLKEALQKEIDIKDTPLWKKHNELRVRLAEDKLTRGIKGADAAEKEDMACLLFLMQLGDAQNLDVDKQLSDSSGMINALATGRVKFKLPPMDKADAEVFTSAVLKGTRDLSNGVNWTVTYGKNSLSVDVGGTREVLDETGMTEVDLSRVNPKLMSEMIHAFHNKVYGISAEDMNTYLEILGGSNLGKEQMAGFVIGLGKDEDGKDMANAADMNRAAKEIDPPAVLTQEEYDIVDRLYSFAPQGERKYKVPEPMNTADFEKKLDEEGFVDAKDYFTKHLVFYREQVNQMKLYAEAAERMHNVLEENERSDHPSDNVRSFAEKKEKELAGKYHECMETCRKLEEGMNTYLLQSERSISTMTNNMKYDDHAMCLRILRSQGQPAFTREKLESSIMEGFGVIDFESGTLKAGEKIAEHKYKLLGVTYKNGDTYQKIIDAMQELKDQRPKDATAENLKEYREKFEHLRDLCEDYIVTHKNPWTPAGKDRRKMVDQLWESMSNVKGEDIEEMAKSVNPGLTIGSQNFHKGDRRKVSIKELQAQEPQRKQRLEAADRKAKANAKQAEHKGEVKKA